MSARFTQTDFVCPPTGVFDATTALQHFAIITYAVDPAKLRDTLPPGFEPEVRTLDDGREVGFVSAVPFLDVDFHAHFAHWYPL